MAHDLKPHPPPTTATARRLLRVDLTDGSTRIEPISRRDLDRFVGGPALAAAILYQLLPPGADPLGPANILVMAPGALTGAPVPGSDRLSLAARSPQTGFIGESTISGPIGEALARAGFAALVITGAASSPVYLRLDDDSITVRDARHIWGLPIPEAIASFAEETPGRGFESMAIGPAGENLIRFAGIADRTGRVAGRTGLGAVMGSKNLKGIVIRGDRRLPLHDPDGLRSRIKVLAERLKRPEVAVYGWSGSVKSLSTLAHLGSLPTANFQQTTGDPVYRLLGDSLLQETDQLRHGCVGCPVACEHRFEPPAASSGPPAVRLEYQSVYALGPLCRIHDLPVIIDAAALCDTLGMDTVSMGATIAWAMESFERGVLTIEQTGGLDLTFGNSAALIECVQLTARREGLGALLAGGSLRAAQSLGGGSAAWTMQIKGLEMPGYDPRHHTGLGMGLAMSARGACHNRAGLGLDNEPLPGDPDSPADRDSSPAGGISREDRQSLMDVLGICKFFRFAFDDLPHECAELLTAVGGPAGADEVHLLPARLATTRRLFNLREGLAPENDSLPTRLLDPTANGSNASDFDEQRTAYYRHRGWTDSGQVPLSTLAALGLEDFAPRSHAGDRPH